MSERPKFEVVQKLFKLNKKIEELRDKKTNIEKKLFKKYGDGAWCYESDLDKEHAFCRLTVSDNIKELKEKDVVFRSFAFAPLSSNIKLLKRKPKDLND